MNSGPAQALQETSWRLPLQQGSLQQGPERLPQAVRLGKTLLVLLGVDYPAEHVHCTI